MKQAPPPIHRTAAQNAQVHSKVYSGSAWMVITRVSIKSIGLVSSIILARLLVPEDFGLVAIAMAIYAFIELFGALGLGTVLIQQQSSDVDDYNTAWTFKVLFGVLAATMLVLLAPVVAGFYQDPRLRDVIYVIALSSVFSGAANIGVINFQKDMNFRRELKYQLMPKLISFVITVTLALVYRNYWALVLGTVSNQLVVMLFSYGMHPFRPRFGLKSFNKLFSFSRWLLLNNVLYFINDRVSELVVGKLLSTSAVGLFSLSREVAQLPAAQVSMPINKATFPVYSRFKDHPEELSKAYLNTVALTLTLTLPAILGIALLAPLLVDVVLGDAWLAMVPLLQLLALASMINGVTVNNGFVYMASGRPDLMFVINLMRTTMFFAFFIPLLNLNGLVGIGEARLATALLMVVVVQIIMMRFLSLKFVQLVAVLLRPVTGCVAMSLAVYMLQRYLLVQSTLLNLVLLAMVGALVYTVVTLTIWTVQGRPDGPEHEFLQRILPRLVAAR